MKHKGFWIAIAVMLVLIIGIIVWQQQQPAQQEEKVVKIGAILPLTGDLAFMGEFEKNGMLVAEEIFKDKNFKIIFEDSRGKASDGVSAANKLINIDNVQFIISSTTGVSRSVASLLNSGNFILFALCMDPTIQNESKYIFRSYYGMEEEANTILEYFKILKENKSSDLGDGVSILHVNHQGALQQTNDYFIPGFKKLGIPIQFVESYEFSQRDFKDIITKIKSKNIKYLILIGYGFLYPTILKQFQEYEILDKITVVGGWGFIIRKNIPVNLLERTIVALPEVVIRKNDMYNEFAILYVKMFNKQPNFDATLAFENIRLILDNFYGLEKTNFEQGIDRLINSKFFSSLGEAKFDNNGRLIIPMTIGVFKGGEVKEWKYNE